MKAKLNEFIEHTFNREGSLYLISKAKRAFSLLYKRILSFAYMFLFNTNYMYRMKTKLN